MTDKERKAWHEQEKHVMVEEGSSDWELAELYKKQHCDSFLTGRILIFEVWRDCDGYLCVQYFNTSGRLLDWFHYSEKNNELVWW